MQHARMKVLHDMIHGQEETRTGAVPSRMQADWSVAGLAAFGLIVCTICMAHGGGMSWADMAQASASILRY